MHFCLARHVPLTELSGYIKKKSAINSIYACLIYISATAGQNILLQLRKPQNELQLPRWNYALFASLHFSKPLIPAQSGKTQ